MARCIKGTFFHALVPLLFICTELRARAPADIIQRKVDVRIPTS